MFCPSLTLNSVQAPRKKQVTTLNSWQAVPLLRPRGQRPIGHIQKTDLDKILIFLKIVQF
jgi:hypothetical protein